jgi:hypothetical protein
MVLPMYRYSTAGDISLFSKDTAAIIPVTDSAKKHAVLIAAIARLIEMVLVSAY